MTISRRLRFEILRRDGYTCRYCGAMAPFVTLAVDHVIPVALAGGDEPSNLVTACTDCNAGKASIQPGSPLVDDIDTAALLWAQAMAKATEARRAELADVDADVMAFRQRWEYWHYGEDETPFPLPTDWVITIERFLVLEVSIDDMARAMETAMRTNGVRDRFRFFCSLVWKEIGARQELARRLIEDGDPR